jgi:hypothetical protein
MARHLNDDALATHIVDERNEKDSRLESFCCVGSFGRSFQWVMWWFVGGRVVDSE